MRSGTLTLEAASQELCSLLKPFHLTRNWNLLQCQQLSNISFTSYSSSPLMTMGGGGVTPQMNFLWKITFDTFYTNEFLIRICDDNLERLYNYFTTTNVYFIGAVYNSYFLIIYKPSTLIISPRIFSTQLGAGTAWFCLSQCAIPFCTLSTGLAVSSLGSDLLE